MSRSNQEEIDKLLASWEGVYKKGLLTFWLLLLLNEQSAYAYEINDAIQSLSQGTISADNNSIYRSLNRFEKMGIVESELQQSDIGPARRYYKLTEKGSLLLTRFINRNILIFQSLQMTERIDAIVKKAN